ncbi:MAG: hypothetical protein FJ387_06830 [Verrucomicrobia bacterium]|nr:hypothetical protein [Verrucomicrobiota bacterium]
MSFDVDTAFAEFQRILKRHPVLVVGTGASCALDARFGMPALAKELCARVKPGSATEGQQWAQVLDALKAGKSLEESLDAATEKSLVNRIVAVTGAFVAGIDHDWAWRVATGQDVPPLSGLLKKLVDGLPPTNPIQHVVTPNYDMLVEHTCDALGIPFTDGFVAGSTCRRNGVAAGDAMLTQTRESRGKAWETVTRYRPHIRLHKVHGSINWFEDDQEERLLRCDRMTDAGPPAGWRRAMITPGKSKLAEVGIKRERFTEADNAIAGATAFLVVGYGFNDDHIQKRIKTKLAEEGCAGIVVTRDWSSRIEQWVRLSKDLWAICQKPDGDKKDSIIVSPGNVDAFLVDSRDLWSVKTFVGAVM